MWKIPGLACYSQVPPAVIEDSWISKFSGARYLSNYLRMHLRSLKYMDRNVPRPHAYKNEGKYLHYICPTCSHKTSSLSHSLGTCEKASVSMWQFDSLECTETTLHTSSTLQELGVDRYAISSIILFCRTSMPHSGIVNRPI